MPAATSFRVTLTGLAALAALAAPSLALAWGATGHRHVGMAAIEGLPPALPGFLLGAAYEVGELSRELDRSRGAGVPHDADLDPSHFIDLDDAGRIGGLALDALPPDREGYERALAKAGINTHDAGYLPYAMAGAWQQLVSDFAYWRISVWGERHAKTAQERIWYAADRARREALILRDAGVYSHYVADAAMPLHATHHHNGWEGDNPKGYTTYRLHAPVEGAFVRGFISLVDVKQAMPAPRSRPGEPLANAAALIGDSWRQVEPLYALDKDGGFRNGDPRGRAFLTGRLALAAAELRDQLTDAWAASATAKVGYQPSVSIEDVEAGRVDPFPSVFGRD